MFSFVFMEFFFLSVLWEIHTDEVILASDSGRDVLGCQAL